MDLLKQLKNLLKIPGNRVIIVEDGKPAYVMTTMEEYLKLVAGKTAQEKQETDTGSDLSDLIETEEKDSNFKEWMADVNKVLAEVAEKETPEESELEQDDEELKIEDLPF